MKTLQDVAKSFKKAAGKAIYPGVSYSGYKTGSSKAFKTGKLLSKFVTSPYNNPNNIGRKTKNGFEFVLEVGPDGATYGRYVHYGTVKMKKRPFAELATQDKEFQSVLNEFLGNEVDEFVQEEMEVFEDYFKKAGFTIS